MLQAETGRSPLHSTNPTEFLIISTVTKSIETNYHYGWRTMLTAQSCVVLFGQYGKESGSWRLTKYDMKTGEELGGKTLTDHERPHGMTEVVLDEKICVALCYW